MAKGRGGPRLASTPIKLLSAKHLAQVTTEGNSLDKLEWKISGCCERLRDEAQKAVSGK
jgi:hypothetical protein